MAPLIKDATQDTPEVSFDQATGRLSMTGTSIPENARKFFEPLVNWIEEYSKDPATNTTFSFKFKYFNTASTKYLFDIMVLSKNIMKEGNTLVFNWFFAEDDDDMYEAGLGFSKMLRYPFNFVKY